MAGLGKTQGLAGAAVAALLLLAGATPTLAETIEGALIRAYQNNPQLNAQRASVRSTDENVPQALSGYRPRVAVTASAGGQYIDTHSRNAPDLPVQTLSGSNAPRSVGGTITQNSL